MTLRRSKTAQDAPKTLPRRLQGAPRTSQEASKTPPRRLQDGPRCLQRRFGSPKTAQEASKPAPEPSRPRFWTIFDWFLVHFWLIFGPCLTVFWLILNHFLYWFYISFQDSKKQAMQHRKQKKTWHESGRASRYVQKDGDSFYLIWGGLAVRRQGDLPVHRQQYLVYMIFDDQLVKHHPKVMHNQEWLRKHVVLRNKTSASSIGYWTCHHLKKKGTAPSAISIGYLSIKKFWHITSWCTIRNIADVLLTFVDCATNF